MARTAERANFETKIAELESKVDDLLDQISVLEARLCLAECLSLEDFEAEINLPGGAA